MADARRPVIAGNWKMNTSADEALALAEALAEALKESAPDGVDVVLAPPFPYLERVSKAIEGCPIALGAQDAAWEEKGAFTGMVSPAMLLDVGCAYVILGHSERRIHLGESDDLINRKVVACLKAGLTSIVCVGESASARKGNRATSVVARQLSGCLKGVDGAALRRMIIAYEPVWAIGTGENATPEQAQEMHTFIRATLACEVDAGAAAELRIQYGGSVNPENIGPLMAQPDVDGALVGGASLKAETFLPIIRYRGK
ncbi:MAG: triose-phosphate isomerase [Nitrospinota bacterium]